MRHAMSAGSLHPAIAGADWALVLILAGSKETIGHPAADAMRACVNEFVRDRKCLLIGGRGDDWSKVGYFRLILMPASAVRQLDVAICASADLMDF